MNIQFTLATRYLLGRKLRTFLTTLAVIFGVMIIFGLGGMLPIMKKVFRQNLMASVGKVDLSVTHVTGGTFSPAVLETVRGTAGIGEATGLLRQNILLPASLGRLSGPLSSVNALTVSGVDPVTIQRVRSYSLLAGRFLQEVDQDAMVIPESLAKRLSLAVGDTFTLPSSTGKAEFEIVGIVAARAVPGAAEVYVPLAAAEKLLNHPGQINTIEALFAPGVDRAKVEAQLRERLDNGYKLGPVEFGSELLASLRIAELAYNLVGLMALAMGGFIIFNTFRTVLAERRRDLGMLRAVGASRRMVLGIILAESLVQGILGTAIGMVAGYAFSVGLLTVIGPVLREFVHVELGWPAPTIANVVESIVLGVGITVASGLFPAISASRVMPLEALRPVMGSVYERTAAWRAAFGVVLIVLAVLGLLSGVFSLAALSTVLFLVGMVMVAPALVKPIANTFGRLLGLIFAREGQIAQGNLGRQPGRAAVTASAMMIGLAIVIAVAGVMSSIREGFLGYLDRSLGADFLVMPFSLLLGGGNLGAAPELAQRLREVPGIAAVTTLRLAIAEAKGTSIQLIGIDPETYPAVAGLEFKQGDPEQAYTALGRERAIIVNGIFAAQHAVRVGNVLTLRTPEGDRDYRVVGIGLDYLNSKLSTGYISQANLAGDFHQTSDVLLLANMVVGTDVAAGRNSLEELIKGYPTFTLLDSAAFRKSQEQIFNSSLAMMYALMIMLALPGLIAMINTLAISVIERTREIGVLRAVGSTQKQVRRMILAESLLLAMAGTGFGILAGLWLGYVMAGAMNVSGFVLRYYFPYTGVLLAIAVGLVFGVLAASLPARQAARLEIVTALRYE